MVSACSIISDAQDISTRVKARWSIAKEIDDYKKMHEKRERGFSSGCNALGIILGSAMMIQSPYYSRELCCLSGCLIDTLACMSCCADIQLFRGDSRGFGSMIYDWYRYDWYRLAKNTC